MLFGKDHKLVERDENEPVFDKKNKVDRKILFLVILGLSILTILIIGGFLLYYLVIKR